MQKHKGDDLQYVNIKSHFGSELSNYPLHAYNHFPDKVCENCRLSLSKRSTRTFGETSIFLVINDIKVDSITKISSRYDKVARGIYHPDESHLLVVNRFTTKENAFDILSMSSILKYGDMVDQDVNDSLMPVPNFFHFVFGIDDNECHLPSDFKIYVLESESGKFYKKEYWFSGAYMPNSWKNGYTKGVALSGKRQMAIYWIVIW